MPGEKSTLDPEHLPTKFGMEFIAKFYRLLEGAALYDRNNDIIDRLTQECLQVVNGILQSEGNLLLETVTKKTGK